MGQNHLSSSIKKKNVLVVGQNTWGMGRIVSEVEKLDEVQITGQLRTGEEAVTLYREFSPDIILVNLILIGMTGLEMIKWIHQQDKSIALYVCSSVSDRAVMEAAIQCGAAGWIKSDIDSDSLVDILLAAKKQGPETFEREPQKR